METLLVILVTTLGSITLQLYPDKAPDTVANFVQYAEAGHYNGTVFHRVIDGFMIQGGGFTADMDKKDTRPPIKNEANNGLKNDIGTIAMARTGDPHSATAQFFINVANNDFLNFRSESMQGWGYTVFGEVTEGLDVVFEIAHAQTTKVGPFSDVPVKPIVIKEVRVIRQAAEAASAAQ